MIKLSNFYCITKFKKFYSEFKNKEFNLLDVGCGNHSPSVTKKWFPRAHYFGIDKGIYNNSEEDLALMERFFSIDLTKTDLSDIPNNFFDLIICSHIIEHLPNSLDVIKDLSQKLKPKGKIYVEFPSVKSLGFPSAHGTLHFCDDNTHIRLYSIKDVANAFLESGICVKKAGTSRDILRAFLFLFTLPYQLLFFIKHRKMNVKYGIWDFFGFAQFVYGEKQSNQNETL